MHSVLGHCTVDTRIDTCALNEAVSRSVLVPETGISDDPQHLSCQNSSILTVDLKYDITATHPPESETWCQNESHKKVLTT